MIKKTVRLLQPTYLRDFHCIGPDCEDHCCWGWQVTVDRKTYNLYRNSRDPVLKPRFVQALKRNHRDPTDDNYAVLENHGGVCPMLTVEKLCSIQLRLSEKALCHTCTVYPRSGALVAGRHEIVGVVSCPELARRALLRPEGIQLEEVETPIAGVAARLNFTRSVNPDQPEHPSDRFFQPLRDFSLRMLQHRAWPLWRRLAGLALFCRLADQRVAQGQAESLSGLIDTFNTLLDDGGLAAQIDRIQLDTTALQCQVLDALGVERIYQGLQ